MAENLRTTNFSNSEEINEDYYFIPEEGEP
jgi:hypothetical protein